MPTFDLLAEPWIPVVREDGTRDEVGLRKALLDAPRIRAISDPMPTVEFGLYRLLVALVMDIFELKEVRQLGDLLRAGEFDAARVEAYFRKWGDRFDLFHPEHPFMQAAGMAGEEKPLAALLPAIPSGTSTTHFHHASEDGFAVCPPVAARLLASVAPFMTAGGAGLSPSINGAPAWYVLVAGDTLFETVSLNCCVLPLSAAQGDAPPAWRDDRPLPEGRATKASLLEALTWRPRRIHLIPGTSGRCAISQREHAVLVRAMYFAAGLSCDLAWRDPSLAYRVADSRVTPVRPREGHDLWRDTGPLALLQQRDYESEGGRTALRFERPAVVTQFGDLVTEAAVGRGAELRLVAYGMRTDLHMKVFEWQRETLSLPAPLVWRGAFRAEAQRAIDRAESVAYHLGKAAKMAYPREGDGNQSAFASRIAQSQRRFWSDLRSDYDLFLKRLADLPEDDYDKALAVCISAWNERLRKVGRQALDDAIGDLDTDADTLVRMVNARDYFARQLHFALLSPEERAALAPKRPRGRKATSGQTHERR